MTYSDEIIKAGKAPVQCQFLLFNKKSTESANELVKKGDSLQNIQKPSKLGPREPEINDAKDCFDKRAQRLQAERDFDRNIKSKFD